MNLIPKDWFEFILDLNLLDNYFKLNQNANDSFGCSLIIQFLYHANMTEQVYNNSFITASISTTSSSNTLVNNTTNKSNESNGSTSTSSSISSVTSGSVGSGSTIVSNQQQQLTTGVSTTTGPNQLEFKYKRIRILRVLAVKTACILKWNLLKFEKEVPVAVMSDLLHIFLRYTILNIDQKVHSQLEIEKLENYSLFALQLLHRWCLRIIIFSKYPKRLPPKSAAISVPGMVNPLQHMKEANENILKVLINNAQESVDFLEKCLNNLTHDICMPNTDCFTNLSSESGSFDIIWSNSDTIKLEEVKSLISFDLGTYYFQMENYQKAYRYFQQAFHFKKQVNHFLQVIYRYRVVAILHSAEVNDSVNNEMSLFNLYLNELDSYLSTCEAMLSDLEISNNTIDYSSTIQQQQQQQDAIASSKTSLRKLVKIMEKNPEKYLQEILNLFTEDNLNFEFSISLRLNYENQFNKKLNNQSFTNRIQSCNFIRLVMESSYFSWINLKSDTGELIPQIQSVSIKSLASKIKLNIESFLEFYANKFDTHFSTTTTSTTNTRRSNIKKNPFSAMNYELNRSIFARNYFKKDAFLILNHAKLILQSSDSQSIINSADKFSNIFAESKSRSYENNELKSTTSKMEVEETSWDTDNFPNCKNLLNFENKIEPTQISSSIKHFWSKWRLEAYKILRRDLVDSLRNDMSNEILKTNSKNDIEYFLICVSKVNELVSLRKFSQSLSLLKSLEKFGLRNTRILLDLILYVNILKQLNELDFKDIYYNKNKYRSKAYYYEQVFRECKDYFLFNKINSDIQINVLRAILAFIISIGEFEYLIQLVCQDSNIKQYSSQIKQKNTQNKYSGLGIVEMSKQFSRLCIELEKTERITSRKLARELWDSIIEIFTDSVGSKRSTNNNDLIGTFHMSSYDSSTSSSSSSYNPTSFNSQLSSTESSSSSMDRESLKKFLLLIKNPLVSNLIISLFSTLYNIGDSMVNNEIFSEYRHLWPSSLANSNSLNLYSILDLMNSILTNYMQTIEPFDIYWLRTNADILFSQSNHFDSLKFFLQIIVLDTKYFFKYEKFFKRKDEEQQQQLQHVDDFNEKSLKLMIKSTINLNKHTHAALLSQMLTDNNDYVNVFKCLIDKTMPTLDEMDLLYTCIWDVTLIEFLTYLNSTRGQIDKRNACLKMISSSCLNPANPSEIFEKTVECKKICLFLKFIKHYMSF